MNVWWEMDGTQSDNTAGRGHVDPTTNPAPATGEGSSPSRRSDSYKKFGKKTPSHRYRNDPKRRFGDS